MVLLDPLEARNLSVHPIGHPLDMRPRVCLSSPDLGRFPRFAGATGYEVTLRPGDCLFLPRMWWHEIDSLSESLSLVRRALDLGPFSNADPRVITDD